jgi:hypothetical protein
MSGAISPLLQYAFMAWCSVEAQGHLYLHLYHLFKPFSRRILILVDMDIFLISYAEEIDFLNYSSSARNLKF